MLFGVSGGHAVVLFLSVCLYGSTNVFICVSLRGVYLIADRCL